LAQQYIVWDFDGTLAERTGQWSGALAEVLRRARPDSSATAADLRPHLQAGFPWHAPGIARSRRTADEWWGSLEPVFERAFRQGAGLDAADAARLATMVRLEYTDPGSWRLFDDTLPVLKDLSAEGWAHFVLSNHVPELEDLIDALGLGALVERVFNSARTGYEKPHPEAFRQVSHAIPDGARCVMVGDSFAADVRGAEGVGWPAVLVRRHHPEAKLCCTSLLELSRALESV
jgi:putative hydrolase of the HAD superfamily